MWQYNRIGHKTTICFCALFVKINFRNEVSKYPTFVKPLNTFFVSVLKFNYEDFISNEPQYYLLPNKYTVRKIDKLTYDVEDEDTFNIRDVKKGLDISTGDEWIYEIEIELKDSKTGYTENVVYYIIK